MIRARSRYSSSLDSFVIISRIIVGAMAVKSLDSTEIIQILGIVCCVVHEVARSYQYSTNLQRRNHHYRTLDYCCCSWRDNRRTLAVLRIQSCYRDTNRPKRIIDQTILGHCWLSRAFVNLNWIETQIGMQSSWECSSAILLLLQQDVYERWP